MARHEHYLAANMGIQSHFKVLDIGCGVGGPAREIGHFTHASFVDFFFGIVRLGYLLPLLQIPSS